MKDTEAQSVLFIFYNISLAGLLQWGLQLERDREISSDFPASHGQRTSEKWTKPCRHEASALGRCQGATSSAFLRGALRRLLARLISGDILITEATRDGKLIKRLSGGTEGISSEVWLQVHVMPRVWHPVMRMQKYFNQSTRAGYLIPFRLGFYGETVFSRRDTFSISRKAPLIQNSK